MSANRPAGKEPPYMKSSTKSILRIGGFIFLLFLAIHYWPAVSGFLGTVLHAAFPLLLGCLLAYILNILMSFYERTLFKRFQDKRWRSPVCLLIAVISLLAILALLFALVIPELAACVELLISQLPGAIEWVVEKLSSLDFISDELIATLNSIDWKSKIGDFFQLLTSGIGSVVDVVFTTVSSLISGIVTLFMALIFSFYLLLSRDRLASQSTRVLKRYMSEKHYEKLLYVLRVFNRSFHRYITGQCIEAVILGTLCAIGMAILRLPYATMIGALVGFTALIPIAGAYIGAIVGAFMILTVEPIKALIFLIFLVVLQQVEGNLIYPKVVGTSLGLPGIWVLAAVTVGGGVMGIPGMLLGVPLASALYTLLRNDVNKKPVPPATPPEENSTPQ